MSSKTCFYLTLFGGWLGLHKFATGKIKMGFIYLFTFGLFGIGWIYDIIKARTVSRSIPSSNYRDAVNILNEKTDIYYTNMQAIESMWSVMYNLKVVSGEKADLFETRCKENIIELYDMLNAAKKARYDSSVPPHVPAYIRLCMLYEKQEKYQNAINICVEAIKAGATDDGNKGMMYGRLARLIRKSGIDVGDDILALSLKS